MTILVIDTCTERGVVALVENQANLLRLLFSRELPFGYSNSKYLLPAISEGLHKIQKSVQDLSLIVVGAGPGSYTGIRVGAIVGKTIAYACNKPLIGVCTLEGFVPKEEKKGNYAVLIDAKIGGAYLLIRRFNEEPGLPKVSPLSEVSELVKEIDQLLTPNGERLKPLLKLNKEWHELAPDPIHLAHSALHKLAQGESNDQAGLKLLYLRATQAEIDKIRPLA